MIGMSSAPLKESRFGATRTIGLSKVTSTALTGLQTKTRDYRKPCKVELQELIHLEIEVQEFIEVRNTAPKGTRKMVEWVKIAIVDSKSETASKVIVTINIKRFNSL